MAIIELKNIVKTFPSEKVGEGVHAVRDVSLAIEEGDIFGTPVRVNPPWFVASISWKNRQAERLS